MISLRLQSAIGASLIAHLQSAPEQVAFLQGFKSQEPDTFEVVELFKLDDHDLDFDSYHVDLSDEGRQRVFSWAAGAADILIEAHSHGPLGDPAIMSLVDLRGLSEWVPHIRWRLSNRPYAALVFGVDTFDGLVWLDDSSPIRMSRLELGSRTLQATGRSIGRWEGAGNA